MCKLKSGIVLKDRIFLPDYDSHEKMLKELGIEDNYLNASKTFVRFEYSPIDNDAFSPISKWCLKIDQDIIPEWFNEDEYLPRILKEVEKWAKTHIHIGVDNLEINDNANHYIKNCKNATIYDSATVTACGSATVEAYDSATVTACDSATVTAYVSATVKAYDSATVTACDSATVKAYGSATVKAYGSATVEACGLTTVEAYGSATVIIPTWSSNNRNNIIIGGNATIKDCKTKTIWQSGDWTLCKYEGDDKK